MIIEKFRKTKNGPIYISLYGTFNGLGVEVHNIRTEDIKVAKQKALVALEKAVKELGGSTEEKLEHCCGTCSYWREGTLDRGVCRRKRISRHTHSAESCEDWYGSKAADQEED